MNKKLKLIIPIAILGVLLIVAGVFYNSLAGQVETADPLSSANGSQLLNDMTDAVADANAAAEQNANQPTEQGQQQGNSQNASAGAIDDSANSDQQATADEADQADEAATNEASPEPAPEEQAANPDIIPAIDITIADFDGLTYNLADFYGKPIVLNFWASWCPPCREEMPHFENVYLEMGDEVEFIMLNSTDGQETMEAGQAFIDENGYTFPVYFDYDGEVTGNASYDYYIMYLPTTFFIDAEGNVVAVAEQGLSEEQLREGIAIAKGEQTL